MKKRLSDLERVQVSPEVMRQRMTGEKLEFIRYTYQPGATFAEHHHEAEQMTIVIEGQLVYEFGEEQVRLDSGDAIIIPGNEPHGAHVPQSAGVTITYNLFTPVREHLPSA